MSFVPTRFIHANHLCLDHQPRGVGEVSSESQITLEDCTLTTFDHVIKACVEHEIDFLLLSGNTLIEEDHSIRGKIALMDGFFQLASKNIPVFILPGQNDSLKLERAQFNWPGNVTFLSSQDTETLEIMREEELVATIQVLSPSQDKMETTLNLNQRNHLFNKHDQRAMSIGILPASLSSESASQNAETEPFTTPSLTAEIKEVAVDYLALSKGTQRYTFEMQPGIAHHPGTAQGLNFDAIENNGVTLVSVRPEEQLDLRTLNLSTVRWIDIELNLDRETSLKQLKHLMRETLYSYKIGALEKLWMVHWQLAGSGNLLHSLNTSKKQSELLTEIESEIKDHIPLLFEQSLEIQNLVSDVNGTQAPLMTRYRHQLETFQMANATPLDKLLVDAAHLDPVWHQRLDSMKTKLNEKHIFNTAIRNGHDWLNIPSDEEIHS